MKQNIVFFGSGSYTIPVIEKLIPHGLNLVITTEEVGSITSFCKKNDIKVISANSAKDLISHKSLIVNHTLGVLASFGVLIPDEVITLFPNGIVNIHPSLLPKWKGPSPIQYTLLNKDKVTGVTVIKMDNEFDHGPILSQKEYKLKGDETTQLLLHRLFSMGAEMVEELVGKLKQGAALSETPQNHSKETWSEELIRDSGHIDLSKLNTQSYTLDAMIRAYYPWPGVWFNWKMENGKTKIVKLLPNKKIQVEGKTPMSYKDFINGYGKEGKLVLTKLNLIND